MDTMVELTCRCGKNFTRRLGEVNRNKKLDRENFCSKSCSGNVFIKNIPVERDVSNLRRGGAGRLRNELSPFKIIISKCKQRKSLDITPDDLKQLWEKQNGVCPFTGWKLVLRQSNSEKIPYVPNRASLDRIDSSKGYTKDNIQFVALIYQYAKNNWSDKDVLDFCISITNRTELM